MSLNPLRPQPNDPGTWMRDPSQHAGGAPLGYKESKRLYDEQMALREANPREYGVDAVIGGMRFRPKPGQSKSAFLDAIKKQNYAALDVDGQDVQFVERVSAASAIAVSNRGK